MTAAREMRRREPDLTYFSPKTEKRESAIDGRGLFARQEIAAGEVVVVKGGYVLTKAQRDELGKKLGPAEIQITEDLFIGPVARRQREGGMMHLNHCCEPNLGVQGQVVYVALRDIAAGEELTFDYAMTDDEPYEMNCRCGRPSCRGTITGFDWRRTEIQHKYFGYFSWHIQRRIDAFDAADRRIGARKLKNFRVLWPCGSARPPRPAAAAARARRQSRRLPERPP
jgi:hypothetical protein